MAEVVLNGVSKIYSSGGAKVVDSLDLRVEDREFCVLVGPSGCGKSTTLRMIAGLEEITEGTISIAGKVVNDVRPKDRDIAMVFQNYALYPHMTVYENMAFGLKLRKFKKSEIDSRVREAAEILGITDYLDRKPKALSGGQRQRVAVGRAIVRKPAVFLFDEPLSNLDAKMRVQMRAEINKLHTRLEATMIYVTHDQTEAMTMADRIVVMKAGVARQIDEPLNVYNHPNDLFVAGFIGTPPMNFFDGVLLSDEGRLTFECREFKIPLPTTWREWAGKYIGKNVVFGIRPENFVSKGLDNGNASMPRIKARVEVVEPMGIETYLFLAVDDKSFVARVPSDVKTAVGREIELGMDVPKAHLFDADTERSISNSTDQ